MMIRTSDSIADIAAALAKAQAELTNVTRDADNPHFRSRYATLAGVLDEVRPKLARHGIAILQMPVNGDGISIGVVTRLMHGSGQWIEGTFFVVPAKADAQGAGSAITYARRYSLMAVTGVGPEDDDDGEAAVGRPPARIYNAPSRPQTAGATRTAGPPPAPAARAVNAAALPPSPEEVPDVTAARQRVKMLIAKYEQIVKTASHARALELAFDDGRKEIKEIEAAGEKGAAAAKELQRRYTARIQELTEPAAAQ